MYILITQIIWLIKNYIRFVFRFLRSILFSFYNLFIFILGRIYHRCFVDNLLASRCHCSYIMPIIDNLKWKNVLISEINWYLFRSLLAWTLYVCRCSNDNLVLLDCLQWSLFLGIHLTSLLLFLTGSFLLHMLLTNWLKSWVLRNHALIHSLSQIDWLLFGFLLSLSSVWRLDWCLVWLLVNLIHVLVT